MITISPLWKLYISAGLIVAPFVLRASPTQYEIKAMVCETYFASNEPGPDGCAIPEVDAAVAGTIATLTLVGLITFFATVMAKRLGLKRTLAISVGVMAAVQGFLVAAVYARAQAGLTLILAGTLLTAIGGTGAASMAITAMISILTQEDGSMSGALGMLGGTLTLVAAVFSVAGGFVYDWHPKAPFIISAVWGLWAPIVVLLIVPDVPLATQLDAKTLDVLRVFGPRKVERRGKEVKDWSLVFAAVGAGLSVIATSYASTEVNIIGMNSFGVTPQEMGALGVSAGVTGLMKAWNGLSKAVFFIFLFPPLSKAAFRYLDRKAAPPPGEAQPLLESLDAPIKLPANGANLYMLMLSVVLELAAVIALAFSTQKWHLFALSTFIPQASGVGALVPALILHFVPPEKRPEAVGATQLLDTSAMATAIFIFGYIFAWLSKINHGQLVFLANGAVGILALGALLFVRMS